MLLVNVRSAPAWMISGAVLLGLSGCQQPRHTMTSTPETGQVINCKLCYDRTVMVRQMHPKGFQFSRNRILTRHMCPDCNVDVETYLEDGTPMLKCAKCAPEGVACDRCLPPTADQTTG